MVHHYEEDYQRKANRSIPRRDWGAVQREYMIELNRYEQAQNTVDPRAWSDFEPGNGCVVLREDKLTTYEEYTR